METRNKVQRFAFLLLVPALLFFWGCSRYQIRNTMESYSHKPGFELSVVHTDSISNDEHVSKLLSYLKGVKEVYILKFDAVKGSVSVNQKLTEKLEKYVKSEHFENLMDIEGKSTVGLYLKKDNQGNIDQVIFIKSGGKHSIYIWAPHSKT